MSINWKVRVKNPVFWVNIAAAVFVPMLAGVGLSWEDMTSWAALWGVIAETVKSPVIVAATVVSVWNALNDPTTAGLSDSARALAYSKPHSDWGK